LVAEEDISRLLLLLYEGAATPARFQVFLNELAQVVNAKGALGEAGVEMPPFALDIQVHEVQNEMEVILSFPILVKMYDVDVFTGYNVNGMDWPFLDIRARQLGISKEFWDMSRVPRFRCTQLELERSSAQAGTRYLAYYNIPGRRSVDMMEEVKQRRPLSQYSMGHVAFTLFVEDRVGQEVAALAKKGLRDEFRAAAYAVFMADAVGKLLKCKPKAEWRKAFRDSATHGVPLYLPEEVLGVLGKVDVPRIARTAETLLQEACKGDLYWEKIEPYWNGAAMDSGLTPAQQRGVVAAYCSQDSEVPLNMYKLLSVGASHAAKAHACALAPQHVTTFMQGATLSCAFKGFCMANDVVVHKHVQLLRSEFPPGYFPTEQDLEEAFEPREEKEEVEVRPRRRDREDEDEDERDDDREMPKEWIEPEEPVEERKPPPEEKKPKSQKQLKREAEEAARSIAYVPAFWGLPAPRPVEWNVRAGTTRPDLTDTRATDKRYAGAYVKDPKTGLYHFPVIVLDYASLYPSIMITFNLSPETILPWNWRTLPEFQHLDPSKDVYHGKMGACWVKKHVRVGLFPKLLKFFMKRRKDVTKLAEAEPPGPKRDMLQQLANTFKTLANAMYGTTGSVSSDFTLVHLAAEVTAIGADSIKKVAHYIEPDEDILKKFDLQKPEIIYGDTDSVFVHAASRKMYDWDGERRVGEMKEDVVFEAAEWLANELNTSGLYEDPMKLAVDKIGKRTLLTKTKKKYCMLAMTKPGAPPKTLSKGLESVRRDSLPATKFTLEKLTDMVLFGTDEVDKTSVYAFVRKRNRQLLGGELPLEDFVMTNKISKPFEQYLGNPLAHVEIVRRMARERPDAPRPGVGDRVSYVYIVDPGAEQAWKRARTVEEIKADPDLKVDSLYYFLNRYRDAVERFLSPFLPEEEIKDILNPVWYASVDGPKNGALQRARAAKRKAGARGRADLIKFIGELLEEVQ